MLSLLSNSDFDAEVICPEGALSSYLTMQGIPVHNVRFARFAFYRKPLWHLGLLMRLYLIIRKSRAEMIVLNLDGNVPIVTLTAMFAGLPLIRFCRFEFSAPRRLDGWCWQRTSAVICPSKTVYEQFVSWSGSSNQNSVHTLYDPCEVSERPNEAKATGNDSQLVGFVGRIDKVKKIETAINVLAEIRNKGVNASLLIAGGGDGSAEADAYLAELRNLAEDLNVGPFTRFVGPLSHKDIGALLDTLDVLILPSASESFGPALVEAWSRGRPTVASDVGACREITTASGGGFLAATGDIAAFSENVMKLLKEPALALEMGKQGRSWVDRSCNPKTYAQSFHAILKQFTN